MTTVAAVERALAERLEKLLVGMGGVEGISIVRNPAEFAKAFDLLAKFKLERGPEVEWWVDIRMWPRPNPADGAGCGGRGAPQEPAGQL